MLRDQALDAVREGVTIADISLPDAPIVYTNQAFLDLTGYRREEVVGRNCRFLQGPDTDGTAVQAIRNAMAQQKAVQVQLLNHKKDGSTFCNNLKLQPVRNAFTGELTSYIGVQSDESELVSCSLLRLAHKPTCSHALLQG